MATTTGPQVLSVTQGGPAAKPGLREDDLIAAIDGVEVHNKAFSEDFVWLHGAVPEPRRSVSRSSGSVAARAHSAALNRRPNDSI